MIPFVLNGNILTLFIDNQPESISNTHVHWNEIQKELKNNNKENIKKLLDVYDIMKKGVYYMYTDFDNNLFCAFGNLVDSTNLTITRIVTLQDFNFCNTVNKDSINLHNLTFQGTFKSIDEVLAKFAKRFI